VNGPPDRRALLAGAAALALSRGQAGPHQEHGTARVAILVRHAEKADDDPRDPSLSTAGQERASALARALGALAVTQLFASPYKRTRLTLQPLAEARELAIETYDARDLTGLAARLRGLPAGAIAVVAGHSNTTPELAQLLGGTLAGLDTKGQFPEDAYDRLVVLPLVACTQDGEPRATATLELRYGA
jgi:phosphohistidine phosphatase SixA